MNLSVFVAGLILAVLLAGAGLAAILVYFEPSSASLFIFVLFYLSLFIGSTGIFTLIGLFVRRISQKRIYSLASSRAFRQLEISFRQGLFLAMILTVVLILQSEKMLTWRHLVALVGLIGLAEWWLSKR